MKTVIRRAAGGERDPHSDQVDGEALRGVVGLENGNADVHREQETEAENGDEAKAPGPLLAEDHGGERDLNQIEQAESGWPGLR